MLHELSAWEQVELLASRQISPGELTAHYQQRIADHPEVGAFVTLTPQVAQRQLAELAEPGSTPLWGLPHADKDLVHRQGVPTLYGSLAVAAATRQYPAQLQAPSEPLIEQCDRLGLISLGKTNTPEFGLFGYTESEVAAPARHPEDLTLNAGGSSGGAAAAVAAGLLPAAIGSDGGGSVRIPAATVGLVGLKPGRGVVATDRGVDSPTGVVTGPLTRSVRDAALFFAALTEGDRTLAERELAAEAAPLRIAFAEDSPWNPSYDCHPEPVVLEALEQGLSLIGAAPDRVSLAHRRYADIFTTAWFRAAGSVPPLLDIELMHPVSRWLIESGRQLSPEQVEQNRQEVAAYGAEMSALLADWDVIVTPALGMAPQPVGSYPLDPQQNFALQVAYSPYTSWVNLVGWPALTVPVTRLPAGHLRQPLPFGIQLVGKPGSEWDLLRLGAALEARVK